VLSTVVPDVPSHPPSSWGYLPFPPPLTLGSNRYEDQGGGRGGGPVKACRRSNASFTVKGGKARSVSFAFAARRCTMRWIRVRAQPPPPPSPNEGVRGGWGRASIVGAECGVEALLLGLLDHRTPDRAAEFLRSAPGVPVGGSGEATGAPTAHPASRVHVLRGGGGTSCDSDPRDTDGPSRAILGMATCSMIMQYMMYTYTISEDQKHPTPNRMETRRRGRCNQSVV